MNLLPRLRHAALVSVLYLPTGQFVAPTAYHKNLHAIIGSPVVFFWNVAKD